jgi:MFS family permease
MRNFHLYLAARVTLTLALQIQLLVVSWHVYQITRSPLSLGYVGLAQFLPSVGLVLVTGHTADRFDRSRILGVCYGLLALGAGALALLSAYGAGVRWIYAVLFLVGCARAFAGPAGQALISQLVPDTELARAVTKISSAWQFATIIGPALGGFLYRSAPSVTWIYGLGACLMVLAAALVLRIRVEPIPTPPRAVSWSTVLAGLTYIFENKVLLGAISLDLLAVLLGGAVALLPAVAQDVLHADASALGALRSAPAAGALLVGLWLTRSPIQRRAGLVMLASVLGFGLATIGFGLARSLPLSLCMLVLIGATDMVSVAIRQTLIQLRTPQEMRGRVSAVNMVFVGASNELGEFESGVTAAWLGTVPAILAGGVGTCLVVILWALLFRELRRYEA